MVLRASLLAAVLTVAGLTGCSRPPAVPAPPDNTATLIVGKWLEENGEITEFTADGRCLSPEITTVNGKVTDKKITEGTYRIVGPRQFEVKFRLEGLAKKPEFTKRFTIKDITADRMVTVGEDGGPASTATRVRE